MPIQIKRGSTHVFLTWGWRYLISSCQRLLVKLFQQRIGPKNWILYGCSYHTWGNMQHIWRDSSLTERGLFPVVSINCSKDNLKKIKVNLLISSQKAMHMTKLLVEVNAIKLDFENLGAQRGGWVALISLPYIYLIWALVCVHEIKYVLFPLWQRLTQRHTETYHKYVLYAEWH